MEPTPSQIIGHLLAGTVVGILMSYLARRKGWNQWGWMIAGWASGALLGFVIGGVVIGVVFYLVRIYHISKAMDQGKISNRRS